MVLSVAAAFSPATQYKVCNVKPQPCHFSILGTTRSFRQESGVNLSLREDVKNIMAKISPLENSRLSSHHYYDENMTRLRK